MSAGASSRTELKVAPSVRINDTFCPADEQSDGGSTGGWPRGEFPLGGTFVHEQRVGFASTFAEI